MKLALLALGTLAALCPAAALAQQLTPAQVCFTAKARAISDGVAGRVNCYLAELLRGKDAIPCLARKEQQLRDAYARAEARGGCPVVGDVDTIATAVAVAAYEIANAAGTSPTD